MIPFIKITENDLNRLKSFFPEEAHKRVEKAVKRYCSGGRSERTP